MASMFLRAEGRPALATTCWCEVRACVTIICAAPAFPGPAVAGGHMPGRVRPHSLDWPAGQLLRPTVNRQDKGCRGSMFDSLDPQWSVCICFDSFLLLVDQCVVQCSGGPSSPSIALGD
jgi:hypothetical protein